MPGFEIRIPAAAALWIAASLSAFAQDDKDPNPPPRGNKSRTETVFSFPCDKYLSGLKGRGNFGALIPGSASPAFGGTYHLAEDVWLSGGTEVKSVADGVVVYSDFSQTWTDDKGRKHYNLGNVIVIEHKLEPPEKDVEYACSFYVHLGKDRKVKTGDEVESIELLDGCQAKILFKGTWKFSILPLLVGSSSPDYKSEPIMCWCSGYGDKATVKEWLRPSDWIRTHPPAKKKK